MLTIHKINLCQAHIMAVVCACSVIGTMYSHVD